MKGVASVRNVIIIENYKGQTLRIEFRRVCKLLNVLLEILVELVSKTGQTSYDIIGELDGYIDMGGPVPAYMGK